MPIGNLAQAKGPQDDWTGLKDSKQRRKLQNRLNVRAHRKRNTQALAATVPRTVQSRSSPLDMVVAPMRRDSQGCLYRKLMSGTIYHPQPSESIQPWKPGPLFLYMCQITRPQTAYLHSEASNRHGLPSHRAFPLSSDHLMPLIELNVMRAVVTNMSILSLPSFLEGECNEFWDMLSPFPHPSSLPSTLIPTALQLSTPHERWIDLLPHPRMRDNAIKYQDRIKYEELEWDVTGRLCTEIAPEDAKRITESGGPEMRGMLVWDDPWCVSGWELTEGFVRRWGFLVEGCPEIFEATNRWRGLRGEEGLVVEVPEN